MQTLEVTVTKTDCELGVASSCRACAVALALERLFPNNIADVGFLYASIHDKETNRTTAFYQLPKKATDFIREYDRSHGKLIKEFTFTITRISPDEQDSSDGDEG